MNRTTIFANITLLMLAVAALSVGLYLFVQQMGDSPSSLVLYATVTLFILLPVAALKLPVSLRMNIAMLLISLAVTLYVLEVFLYFWGNPLDFRTPRYQAALAADIDFDTRSPLQVVADMRRQGTEAYPYISPSNFIDNMPQIDEEPIYALGGISEVGTVYCNESGDYVIYQSDPYGFRNRPELWDLAELDAVALGDSFTQGACVETGESAVDHIRSVYPKTLNLGANGNGPLTSLAALKEYAAIRRPRYVLWLYFEGNDLGDYMNERQNSLLSTYLSEDFSQDLSNRQDEINQVRQEYVNGVMAEIEAGRRREALNTLRLFNLRRLLGWTREKPLSSYLLPTQQATLESAQPTPRIMQMSIIPDRPAMLNSDSPDSGTTAADTPLEPDLLFDVAVPEFKKLLDYTNRYTAEWGGRLIFVYLPHYQRFSSQEPPPEEILYRLEVLRVVAELGIPLVDIKNTFAAHPDPLSLYPFRMDGHYNSTGYALVAEEVLRVMGEVTP